MPTEKVRQLTEQMCLNGILIFSPENIRYLTGFSGSEGYLFAGIDEIELLVDSRYITQAQEEASSCQVYMIDKGIKGVAERLRQRRPSRLGIEAEGVSLASFEALRHELGDVELVPIIGELQRLRVPKSEDEILLMRQAIAIAEEAWKSVQKMIKPGVKEI